MNDILREIFDDKYDITPKRDKKQQELDEKRFAELPIRFCVPPNGEILVIPAPCGGREHEKELRLAEWDKVQRMLGDEFVDRLLDLEGEREDWRAFHYYQAGFRLGVRLVLEALGN